MKKVSIKKCLYQITKENQRRKIEKRKAKVRKARKIKEKKEEKRKKESQVEIIKRIRSNFRKTFYREIHYAQPNKDVVISEQLGIENDFDKFVQIASSFVDSHAQTVHFNIKHCKRLWPSAITLLCSFKQWTEITASKNSKPILSSNSSNFPGVDSYLSHCGFYDYVIREHIPIENNKYDEEEIVKIKRENNSSEIIDREDQIREVIEKFSVLTEEQIEEFDDRVLIEAFNNVTEHGNSYRDNGWWTLTQYHKTTGIISLCLADNGIGIKHSLLTGPQRNDLKKRFNNSDDSDYISAALEENVSGAITGSIKDEKYLYVSKSYARGSRRGNGLKRIREACKNCGVVFSILSQKGYIQIGADGKILRKGTAKSRIFAGTLYHFSIPAKKLNSEVIYENN